MGYTGVNGMSEINQKYIRHVPYKRICIYLDTYNIIRISSGYVIGTGQGFTFFIYEYIYIYINRSIYLYIYKYTCTVNFTSWHMEVNVFIFRITQLIMPDDIIASMLGHLPTPVLSHNRDSDSQTSKVSDRDMAPMGQRKITIGTRTRPSVNVAILLQNLINKNNRI